MSEFPSENQENRTECGVVFMSAVAEASHLLRRVAEPRPIGDSVKQAIARAARRCGLSFTRTEDLWRQEARRVDAEEMDRIRRAANKHNAAQEAKARDELSELRDRLARLEARLLSTDEDFHRPDVDALGELVRRSGGMDRALDRKG